MTNFETEIERNGFIVYTNKGDSMMPLLRQDRDLMVIRKITEPLKRNDAVLFKRPNGAYVMHRIIRVYSDGTYRIGGDNRWFSEIVPGEWILGILTEIIRDGKHISVTEDKDYLQYLKKLPYRRTMMKIRRYGSLIKQKIKRIIGGKKP